MKRGTFIAHISAVNKGPSQLVPRIITKASFVNAHLSAHVGMEVEIGRKPSIPYTTSVHLPYSRKIRQTF